MKKVIRVKNNNMYIGSLRVDLKAIKEFAFTSGAVFVIISSIALFKKNDEVVQSPEQKGKDSIEQDENYVTLTKSVPTYEAEYVVQFGDTLSGIVASYQTDPNKMQKIIERIADINHMSSPNQLIEGKRITLCGIPEEYLSDFGYTIDYSKTEPEFELDDLNDYIKTAISYAYITDENAQYFADFEAKYSFASNLYNTYKESKDELLFDSLIEQYRSLAEEISSLTGYDYSHSIKAHKISEEKGLGL